MPVDGGVEVAAGVDLLHQLAHHALTGPALIAGIGGQDRPALVVEAAEGYHVSLPVVFHFDLGVDAQEHRAHGSAGGVLALRGRGGGGLAGDGRRPAAAGGEHGQRQCGGYRQTNELPIHVLFHVFHLLFKYAGTDWFDCLAIRIRGGLRKTGVPVSFFAPRCLHR